MLNLEQIEDGARQRGLTFERRRTGRCLVDACVVGGVAVKRVRDHLHVAGRVHFTVEDFWCAVDDAARRRTKRRP